MRVFIRVTASSSHILVHRFPVSFALFMRVFHAMCLRANMRVDIALSPLRITLFTQELE